MPTHKCSIIMNIFIFILIIYDSLCDYRKITIPDQAVQKMTEHYFLICLNEKDFICPLAIFFILNLYFLECSCNSGSIVHFAQISVFCHILYFNQPPLWHSSHNTVHVVVVRRPVHILSWTFHTWTTLTRLNFHCLTLSIVFLPLF